MQNILCQQTPPVNHTHFRCDVADHFKKFVRRLFTYTMVPHVKLIKLILYLIQIKNNPMLVFILLPASSMPQCRLLTSVLKHYDSGRLLYITITCT